MTKYKLKRPDTPQCAHREQSPVEKRAHVLAHELHLTDEMRYDLARMVIDVDPDSSGSWKDLDDRQFSDLVTMMEGWIFITKMKLDNG